MTYCEQRAALGGVVALAERRSCNVCRHELCAATRVNPGGASRSPPKERVAVQQLRPVTRRPLALRGWDALRRRRLGRRRRLPPLRASGVAASARAAAPTEATDAIAAPPPGRRGNKATKRRAGIIRATLCAQASSVQQFAWRTDRRLGGAAGGAHRHGAAGRRRPSPACVVYVHTPHACVLRRLPSVKFVVVNGTSILDCGARWIHD